MTNLATRLLGTPKEIVATPGLVHLYRWTIFSTDHFNVYLQHMVGANARNQFGNEPKQFFSFGIAREYRRPGPRTRKVPGGTAWMVLIGRNSERQRTASCD